MKGEIILKDFGIKTPEDLCYPRDERFVIKETVYTQEGKEKAIAIVSDGDLRVFNVFHRGKYLGSYRTDIDASNAIDINKIKIR